MDSGFPTPARHGRNERAIVTKRKISGGTRSIDGRHCRDTFLGLMITTAKLGMAFWDYLGDRLAVPYQPTIHICQTSPVAADSPPVQICHGFCPRYSDK